MERIREHRQWITQRGFTLVEVIIAIAIVILIGLAVASFGRGIFVFNRTVSNSLSAQSEARKALKVMSAELRTTSQSSTGSYALGAVATSSVTFYTNIDDEPLKERIRYFLSGDTLQRGELHASGSPLSYNPAFEVLTDVAHGVANGTSSIFSYYDDSYDGTTAPLGSPIDISSVRLIKVSIFIDHDPLMDPGPIELTTQVSLRNLKDNL